MTDDSTSGAVPYRPAAPHTLEAPPYQLAAPGDTMGIRHVYEAIRDLPFPTRLADVRERAGNWRIPITGAHFHRLSEFLEGVDDRHRYRSPEALARAVLKAHPELRE